MKRILSRVALLTATFSLLVAATGAYFTDQQVKGVNTISGGQIKLDIRGGSLPVTLTGVNPGEWTGPHQVEVYNTSLSTTPIKYRFYDEKLTESVANLYNKLNVRVRHTHAGTPNPAAWPVVYEGKLKDLMVNSETTPGIISSTLGINITHVYQLEFQLDSTAGNEFQNQTAEFNLVFDATQPANPGWTE